MGVLCGMDRVCVVVASPDGAATTVTQCWPESGHDGNRETVFPLPADIAATWWQVFGSGRDVVIPAVNGIDDDLPETGRRFVEAFVDWWNTPGFFAQLPEAQQRLADAVAAVGGP
jgi:hypothetical protein